MCRMLRCGIPFRDVVYSGVLTCCIHTGHWWEKLFNFCSPTLPLSRLHPDLLLIKQWLSHLNCQHSMLECLVCILDAWLLGPLLLIHCVRYSRGQLKCLDSCHTRGRLDRAPGSWLQTRSVLAVVGIWGVNQRVAALFLCICLSNG